MINFLKKLLMVLLFLVKVVPATASTGEPEGFVIKTLWGTYFDAKRTDAQGKVKFSRDIQNAKIYYQEKWNRVRWLLGK